MSDKDEALRLADDADNLALWSDRRSLYNVTKDVRVYAAMLRSQHARIAELEAVARVALELLETFEDAACKRSDKALALYIAAIQSLRKTLGEA